MSNPKLCVAGKNLIAVEVLAAASSRYNVVCCPNPDDVGADDWQPSLRKAAHRLGVPILALEQLYSIEDLCFLSLEYAELIRPTRFASDRLFNLHFSLLPKYRGCNTAVWPILNGETEHGVTLHEIDAGMDTGPIIDHRSFYLQDMTAFDAYMTCQKLGVELVLQWLPTLLAGTYTASPQCGAGSLYRRSDLDYGLKEISLSDSRDAVLRRIRAFTFPAYQLPTVDGRGIVEASKVPFEGGVRHEASDGPVYLRFV